MTASAPTPVEISPEEAFALMLETACEDFEILQSLARRDIQVFPVRIAAQHQELRALRAPARIQMALAKSFVFNAVRARRICDTAAGHLKLDRFDRKRFLKATEPLIRIRDVIEHGCELNADSRPALHEHPQEGKVDETSLLLINSEMILMGPLNLYAAFVGVERMRKLAGFAALTKKNEQVHERLFGLS